MLVFDGMQENMKAHTVLALTTCTFPAIVLKGHYVISDLYGILQAASRSNNREAAACWEIGACRENTEYPH